MQMIGIDGTNLKKIVHIQTKIPLVIDPKILYRIPQIDIIIKRSITCEIELLEYVNQAYLDVEIYQRTFKVPFGFRLIHEEINIGVNGELTLEIGNLNQFHPSIKDDQITVDEYHELNRDAFNSILKQSMITVIQENPSFQNLNIQSLSKLIKDYALSKYWKNYGLILNDFVIFNQPFAASKPKTTSAYSLI